MPACHAGDRGFDSRRDRFILCGCSLVVKLQPSKLLSRVRFSSPALILSWPVGQAVKTPPFHGGNTGSSPVRVILKSTCVGFFYCKNYIEIKKNSPYHREKGEFFRKIMEPRGVEPLSKYIDTIKSTFIVYLFKFRYRLADKQASS